MFAQIRQISKWHGNINDKQTMMILIPLCCHNFSCTDRELNKKKKLFTVNLLLPNKSQHILLPFLYSFMQSTLLNMRNISFLQLKAVHYLLQWPEYKWTLKRTNTCLRTVLHNLDQDCSQKFVWKLPPQIRAWPWQVSSQCHHWHVILPQTYPAWTRLK